MFVFLKRLMARQREDAGEYCLLLVCFFKLDVLSIPRHTNLLSIELRRLVNFMSHDLTDLNIKLQTLPYFLETNTNFDLIESLM